MADTSAGMADTPATTLADGSVGSEDSVKSLSTSSGEDDAACRLLCHSRRHHCYEEDSGIEWSSGSLCLKERSRCDEDSSLGLSLHHVGVTLIFITHSLIRKANQNRLITNKK